MRTFDDATGVCWRVQLDLTAAMRVDEAEIQHRGETLVLTDPDKWVFPALLRSPALNARILYQVCRPQADELQVTQDEFTGRLSALKTDEAGGKEPVLTGAITALVAEMIDFFQPCPTSLNRLLRARERVIQLLATATAALESDRHPVTPPANAADEPTTTSTGCPPVPGSTGEPLASLSAS